MKNTENLKIKNADGRRRQIWGLLGDASPIAAAFQVKTVVINDHGGDHCDDDGGDDDDHGDGGVGDDNTI